MNIINTCLFLGSKPFSCQICGRAFRQRSQQLGHEATHANSGVLSVAANIAASQQVQINNDKSPIDQRFSVKTLSVVKFQNVKIINENHIEKYSKKLNNKYSNILKKI